MLLNYYLLRILYNILKHVADVKVRDKWYWGGCGCEFSKMFGSEISWEGEGSTHHLLLVHHINGSVSRVCSASILSLIS